jgi:hypothetical protein
MNYTFKSLLAKTPKGFDFLLNSIFLQHLVLLCCLSSFKIASPISSSNSTWVGSGLNRKF